MISMDINSLRTAYADGRATPQQIIDHIFRRMQDLGNNSAWISRFGKDEVLDALAQAPRGPLWGIPFAVKDNIDVLGLPTTAACPDFAYLPTRSATVVERLQAAGAIVIGKTNLDQFATGLVGTRSPYGICSSVFSRDHISGGSSSGSAVVVADHLVSFSLGTDTAGSGRVPAAFNNLVGLKPTKGLISTQGVVPACRSQDCVSVFALTVADAFAVLSCAAAFDPQDSYSRPLPTPLAVKTGRLRFGVPRGDIPFFGDDQAQSLYAQAIQRMQDLGHQRVDIDFAPFAQAARLLYSGPWVAERLAALGDFPQRHPAALHPVVQQIILGAKDINAVDGFRGFYQLADLIRQAEPQWDLMDVMLLPTTGTTYTIQQVLDNPIGLNSNLGTYTNFVNLMDLSALAVPAGFRPNGLPFGVTLMGRAGQDGLLAMVGDQLHRAHPTARLGGSGSPLAQTPDLAARTAPHTVQVAVVGAHLAGQPLHGQLVERRARLVRTCRTAAGYGFYALPGTTPRKPGLIHDGQAAGHIEVEIYQMDHAAFGSFVALIPPPLGIGTITLEDGSQVKGFLCESHAIQGAEEITALGGWRAWLAQQTS